MSQRTRSARRRSLRLAIPALVLALLAGACTSSDDEAGSSSASGSSGSGSSGSGSSGSGGATASPQTGTTGSGTGAGSGTGSGATDRVVGVRLSQGKAAPADPTAVVDGDALPADRIKAIIDRLPTWAADEDLTEPFAWPTQTIKPPTGGTAVDQPFPPEDPNTEPPTDPDATGPLQVLRVQPEGAVTIAPFASITFSQPMVPIGTVGQVEQGAAGGGVTVPATISPEVPGHWEWIGTQTLRFVGESESTDRLPMATDYTVTVPAGTTSATGAALAEPVTFRFSTPAVTVKSFSPKGSGLDLQPVFVAVFDQQIDVDAVLAATTLTAGDTDAAIRQATAAEVEADEDATQAVSGVPDGRWLAFRPTQPLATDTPITVTFAKGLPSAEGPTTTPKPITFTGRTYAPLKLTKASCPDRCYPGSQLQLVFNNPLDADAFDPDTITVTPALAGHTVEVYEKTIVITGVTEPSTTYTITVPADVTDEFGQTLGTEQVKTITIDEGRPRLIPFSFPLTTLDPLADDKSISVRSIGRTEFRLRVFAVNPDQWAQYQTFFQNQLSRYEPNATVVVPDWPVLTDEKVAVAGAGGKTVDTTIDLSDELAAAGVAGHVVVLVESTHKDGISRDEWWENQPTATWVQSTSIGLDAWTDPSQVRVWATDLRTGEPLEGVAITPISVGDPATTDADGRAVFDLVAMRGVTAERDGETAVLPADMWMSTWEKQPVREELRWFVNDDRQTYRPGETASLKGWVRVLDADAQLKAVADGAKLRYTVRDQMGNELDKGSVDLGRLGGFDFTVEIPAGAALGPTTVDLQLTGTSIENNYYGHSFTIADFRTPDFEVTVQPGTADPHLADSPFSVDADAAYYAGGPLGAAPVAWQVRTAPATYSPPGWDRFTFGIWTPWWLDSARYYNPYGYGYGGYGYDMGYPDESEDAVVDEFDGVTDAQGAHHLQVEVGDLGEKYDGLPATVTAQATVTDVNRQALAGTTDVLVHSADYYVGLSSETTFVRKGEPIVVSAVVTDIDGKATAGRQVQIRAAQVTTSWVNGQSEETESETGIQACSVASAAEPVTCTFQPEIGGSYRITATVTDDSGRHSRSQLTRWVSGGTASAISYVEEESVTLVPDTDEYAPGETATVLVQSPIATGTGMLTISRVGITSTRAFDIVDGSAVLEIPVADEDIPTINLSVEVVGATPRTGADGQPLADAAPRPAFATGQLALAISTAGRELDVDVVPRDPTVKPGGSTAVDVTVRDADGKPVADSEFELVVVDEAVLALGGYDPVDPLDVFYSAVYSRVQATYGRSSIALGQVPQGGGSDSAGASTVAASAAEESAAPASPRATSADQADGGAALSGSKAPAGTPIPERTDFDPLAVFEPSVITDANGKATVEVDLPDNLTRYRVIAVAVDDVDRFGTGESTITAGLPLAVRPTAPRFLNFGDTFELPVVVQNNSATATTVDVVVQAANLNVELAGKQITVPADDRVEVRFAMSTAAVGTGKLRVAAVGADPDSTDADAATVELPVYTPATSETFAGYGVIDSDTTIAQPLLAPEGVIAEFGGLQVTTSSTALANLTDAVLYLTDYPYESSDGLASQVLAIATLGEVLQAFEAPGLPSPEKLTAAATDKIEQLVAMQNEDGGWPYWQKGRETSPFNSVLVTQALAVAAAQGFTVPKDTLDAANTYLEDIRSHLPAELSQQDKDTIVAAALNVRMESGDRDTAAANALVTERGDSLPLDALAWLWPVVDDPAAAAAIDAKVKESAVDTAGAVTFTESVDDGDWTLLRSDRRTDALVLDALVRVQPDSDLIPKAVAGLMAGQGTNGRWDTAQENSFALVALKRYFDTFEATPADFVAKVWLDDRFAGQHDFSGHTNEVTNLDIPTAELVKAGDTDLTLSNDGTGRLYYRVGLQTAPADFDLDPLDRGFVVARTYEAVDDPADVTRDADGTWHIKAGALVRVKLALVARSQRTGVALIDPIPAGLEILNPDLETTPEDLTGEAEGDSQDQVQPRCCWWGTWYDHENLRDDRAEAYASYLPAGDYEYRYLARATTPGSFVVPPTRAEEIYAPETFGRAGSDAVVVEP